MPVKYEKSILTVAYTTEISISLWCYSGVRILSLQRNAECDKHSILKKVQQEKVKCVVRGAEESQVHVLASPIQGDTHAVNKFHDGTRGVKDNASVVKMGKKLPSKRMQGTRTTDIIIIEPLVKIKCNKNI